MLLFIYNDRYYCYSSIISYTVCYNCILSTQTRDNIWQTVKSQLISVWSMDVLIPREARDIYGLHLLV